VNNPDHADLQEFLRRHGDELRERYGAHSLGIGRKRVGTRRTDQLAVIFYVAHKGDAAKMIPTTLTFTLGDREHPIDLATDVIENTTTRGATRARRIGPAGRRCPGRPVHRHRKGHARDVRPRRVETAPARPPARYLTSNRLAADQAPGFPEASTARARNHIRVTGRVLVA
jgi:hypothetical protein